MLKFIKSKYIPEDNSLMLIIPYVHSIGGAERVAVNLANYFADCTRYKVTLVVISNNKNSYYWLSAKVQLISLEMPEKNNGVYQILVNNIKRIIKFRKLIFTVKPKIIVGFMEIPSFLSCCATIRINNIITIGSIHNNPALSNKFSFEFIIKKFFYKYLSSIVVLTTYAKDYMQQHFNLKNFQVIANPIAYPLIKKNPIIEPHAIIIKNKYTLLAVGRLCYVKGFDLLISVFRELANKYDNWQLVILGVGDQHLKLEQQINTLELQNKVYMPGAVGNLADWYQAADIFVFSSRYEGFGCALTEAMAYGLPAVSFDCKSGPADIIRHGVDGLLVENGNTDELYRSLNILITDEQLRKRFATKAIAVRDRFSIDSIGKKWDKLCIELKK